METLGVLFFIGCILIGAGVITLLRSNKIMAVFVFIGLISILISNNINKGKPALLNTLTTGEKYEVVAVCSGEYIVTKSLTNTNEKQEQLRFIGPLDFDTTSVGVGDVCIKTAEGSLRKIWRNFCDLK